MRSRYDVDIKQIKEALRVRNYDRADITIKDHNPPPGDSTHIHDVRQHELNSMPAYSSSIYSGDTTWLKQIQHGEPQPFSKILCIENYIDCDIEI